jgi:hypothetical protein
MRQKRIYWTEDQQQQILDEAARLSLLNPRWNNLRLIREAQKILAVEYRRNLSMVSWKSSFKWFVDGIKGAVARASHSKVVQGAPAFSENGKHHEPEDLPSAEPVDLSVANLLSTLVKAMEELRDETTKGLPIGIVGRLDDLQARLDKIEGRFQQFLDQGLLVRLVPAGVTVPSVVQPEIPVVPVQKPPLQEPETKTRKPRVMVLNTDSGHVRHGIERGTLGYVSSLKFQDTYGVTTPEFRDFDYVLAYKKTPIPWVELAKKFYPPGKFKAVSGGAVQVADTIKSLPLIQD